MEKENKREYSKLVRGKIMLGFSIKRFFITLGLSIGVWVISNLIQLFNTNNWPGGFLLTSDACTVTGYPIAMCLSEAQRPLILIVYLINIAFWFWVIHFFLNFFFRKRS